MTNKNYHPLLLPIKQIIDNRKTTSDEIIDFFKKKGFKNKINQNVAKEAAIYFSNKFRKDLVKTKNAFDDVRD